ncbi:MAG: DUF6048 family protein [Aurantibacter sp.]
MSKYFISLCFFWSFAIGLAQSDSLETKPKDTVIIFKQKYGLRVGVDLSRPVTKWLGTGYSGIELVGDYRFSQKLFLAGEIGREKKTRQEDLYNFTTSGSYIKVGVDYNTYANWYGEQNSIHVGGRYAFGTFSHTLNSHQIFDSSRYWNPADFPLGSIEAEEFNGLNASWLEAVVGVKVELFANIYLGASARIGFLVSRKRPDNFRSLFIPGFNRVTDASSFGVGYNYSLTYFIPLYKKAKKPKKNAVPEPEE